MRSRCRLQRPRQSRCPRPVPGRPWSARRPSSSSALEWHCGCRPGQMEGGQTGHRSHPVLGCDGVVGGQQVECVVVGAAAGGSRCCCWSSYCLQHQCTHSPEPGRPSCRVRWGVMTSGKHHPLTSLRMKPFSSFCGADKTEGSIGAATLATTARWDRRGSSPLVTLGVNAARCPLIAGHARWASILCVCGGCVERWMS